MKFVKLVVKILGGDGQAVLAQGSLSKERAGGEAFVRAVSVHTVHKTVHIVESLASAINTAEVRGLSTFHGFLYLFFFCGFLSFMSRDFGI